MKKRDKLCGIVHCNEIATHLVSWIGGGVQVCGEHAQKAIDEGMFVRKLNGDEEIDTMDEKVTAIISKEVMEQYEAVRQSGVTDMYDMGGVTITAEAAGFLRSLENRTR